MTARHALVRRPTAPARRVLAAWSRFAERCSSARARWLVALAAVGLGAAAVGALVVSGFETPAHAADPTLPAPETATSATSAGPLLIPSIGVVAADPAPVAADSVAGQLPVQPSDDADLRGAPPVTTAPAPATTSPPAPVAAPPPVLRDCADPLRECECDHDPLVDCAGQTRTTSPATTTTSPSTSTPPSTTEPPAPTDNSTPSVETTAPSSSDPLGDLLDDVLTSSQEPAP